MFEIAPADDALLAAVLVKLFADRQQAVGQAIETVVTTLGAMPVSKGAAAMRSAETEGAAPSDDDATADDEKEPA